MCVGMKGGSACSKHSSCDLVLFHPLSSSAPLSLWGCLLVKMVAKDGSLFLLGSRDSMHSRIDPPFSQVFFNVSLFCKPHHVPSLQEGMNRIRRGERVPKINHMYCFQVI